MAASYKFMGESALTQLIELCHTLALKPKFVRELPETGDERYIYFVYNSSSADGKNIFDEYVWVVPTEEGASPRWELLGSVSLELALDDYVTKETFEALENRVAEIESGEVSDVKFDTTDAPEITVETSKEGSVVNAKFSTNLSDYLKAADLPTFEEISADEVKTIWDSYNA